jgi:hypothetical protein
LGDTSSTIRCNSSLQRRCVAVTLNCHPSGLRRLMNGSGWLKANSFCMEWMMIVPASI